MLVIYYFDTISFLSFKVFHLGQKKLLANSVGDSQLCVGGKEDETYNRVIQGKRYYSNGSLHNNWHLVAIVSHVHYLINKTQCQTGARICISLIV